MITTTVVSSALGRNTAEAVSRLTILPENSDKSEVIIPQTSSFMFPRISQSLSRRSTKGM